MKVALIGSTGRVGGWVLEECLSRGYDVTALVRKASKLDTYQDRISVVEGDATNAKDLRRLILVATMTLTADPTYKLSYQQLGHRTRRHW